MTSRTSITKITLCLFVLLTPFSVGAQRRFIHPGITYTQGDLDRMKAMVEAHQEPFYTTYQAMLSSSYSIPGNGSYSDITQIAEGAFNGTIGADGRRAHDMALLYHITGKRAYADDAVKRLNRYNNLTNASCRGTAPLDNGKIYLLLEAAELLRNYDGWQPTDQAAFKKMLTYPFYSTTKTPDGNWSLNDADNKVSFYWNLFNFDPGRYGNQGLFAARGLVAMGIYLDNDTLYDRAYRYLQNLPHRSDDLPYKSGPPVQTSVASESETQITYNVTWKSDHSDYHSDEVLMYYIYQNGQNQESSRDQAHVMAGIGNYTAIAEMAWNQGDTLYNSLDYRILKGIEYNTRYNLSVLQSYPDQQTAWEPTGFSKDESACTFDNGVYYQATSRSGRWEAKTISSSERGGFGTGGWRAQALAHYRDRMGLDATQTKWLQRSYDHLIANHGYENWGVAPNWFYEWAGWGTLTKNRPTWMLGDASTFVNGQRVSGMPQVPCTLAAVDYDYFPGNGEGRIYHNVGQALSTLYRSDGTIEIAKDDAAFIVTDMNAGEWMSYSVVFPAEVAITGKAPTRHYNIYATYKASGSGARLFASVGDGEKKGKELEAASNWTERLLGTFEVAAGAATVRLFTKGQSGILQLKNIRIEPIEQATLQKVDLSSAATIKVYNTSDNDVSASYTTSIGRATDGSDGTALGLSTQKFLVFDFGEKGLDINQLTLYNDGTTQDSREFGAVLGSTADSLYPSPWSNGLRKDFLRTNGAAQGGLPVPVIENTWSSAGVRGRYTVGPVGKYRYLAFYNWSAPFNASEIEVQTVAYSPIHTPDTEASASWDDPEKTSIAHNKKPGQTHFPIKIHGNEVLAYGATAIEVYSLQGTLLNSMAGERVFIPKGVYILKIIGATTYGKAKVHIY